MGLVVGGWNFLFGRVDTRVDARKHQLLSLLRLPYFIAPFPQSQSTIKLNMPRMTVDDDLGLLIREGFVERDRTGSDGRERFRLTEAGRSQAESMAARTPIANL
jgi:DNA-binding MarR family transcriptional regulator